MFWQYSDLIQLWAYWDAQWMKLGDLEDPKLGYWHHICVAVCPSKGELRASMEGLDMGGVSGKNVGKIPTRLELVIGKWTTSGGVEEQFHGLSDQRSSLCISPRYQGAVKESLFKTRRPSSVEPI